MKNTCNHSELHFDSGQFVLNSDAFRHEKTPEGYLRVYARVARVGDLVYRSDSGAERIEYIEPEDLFDKESINTLKMKPIPVEHPGYLNSRNTLEHLKGVTGNLAVIDGDFLGIVATIYDQDTIDKIERGELREVSCTYRCDTKRQPDGRYRQFNRRYNHLALTKNGRAGELVGLHMDSTLNQPVWIQEQAMKMIEINGQKFPIDAVMSALSDAMTRSDGMMEDEEEEMVKPKRSRGIKSDMGDRMTKKINYDMGKEEEEDVEPEEENYDAISLANDNAVLRMTNSDLRQNLERALQMLEEAKETMVEAAMLDELLNTWEKCRSIVENGYQAGTMAIDGITYDNSVFNFDGIDPMALKQGVMEAKGVKLNNDSADAIDGAFETFINSYVDVNPIEVADRYVRNDSRTLSTAEQARQERIKKMKQRGRS